MLPQILAVEIYSLGMSLISCPGRCHSRSGIVIELGAGRSAFGYLGRKPSGNG
jgi:hypothetical protein